MHPMEPLQQFLAIDEEERGGRKGGGRRIK
jgi:hypothetical protein